MIAHGSCATALHTQHYIQIRQEMEKKYDEFNRLWTMSSWEPDLPIAMPVEPRINTYHPEFGMTTFITLRFPQTYVEQDIHYGFHLPIQSSEENYRKIAQSVMDNQIYFFHANPA